MTLRKYLLISFLFIPRIILCQQERQNESEMHEHVQNNVEERLAREADVKRDKEQQEEWIMILEARNNETVAFRKRLKEALADLEKGIAWPADLPSISEMRAHKNYLARSAIYSAFYSRMLDPEIEKRYQKYYVEMLAESLEDQSPRIWQWTESRLGQFKVKSFSEEAIENVRRRFDSHKSNPIVRLMGRLDIEYAYEQTRSLREMPVEPDPYMPNWTLMSSPPWAPLLVAARKGDKESIRKVIETVEKMPIERRLKRGFRALEYTRRPEVVEYLQEYLESDEPDAPYDITYFYAYAAAQSLSRMLEGFDWPYDSYHIRPSREKLWRLVHDWRQWMRDQSEWKFTE